MENENVFHFLSDFPDLISKRVYLINFFNKSCYSLHRIQMKI